MFPAEAVDFVRFLKAQPSRSSQLEIEMLAEAGPCRSDHPLPPPAISKRPVKAGLTSCPLRSLKIAGHYDLSRWNY